MNKLTKYQQERLSSMPTFEDFQKEYFTQHPKRLQSYKQTVLDEYMKDPSMTINELLSIFRGIAELEGYTKLAKRAKISREHLYRTLAPNSNPTLSTLSKLADSWGMRVGLFFK